jgi:hypothetical protein
MRLLQRNLIFFLNFLLIWTLSSCEKDELTKPTEVYFTFKLDRLPEQEGTVSFESGTMKVRHIVFTGDRQSGEDVSFISDFQTIVQADLGTGNTDPLIKFDIPQGTYTQMSLLVDPTDPAPDILVIGKYEPPLFGPPVPVQVEIDMVGALNLIVQSVDGNREITLRRDAPATIEVFLNPSQWFTALPTNLLETAEVQNIRGVPSILISKNFNPEIYSNLTSLIEVSAEAVFK